MIYKFNKEQYQLCKKYVIQVYEGDMAEIKMHDESKSIEVTAEGLDAFTDAADYAIIHFGMINQDYLTDLGYKLQFLYDEIYAQTIAEQ